MTNSYVVYFQSTGDVADVSATSRSEAITLAAEQTFQSPETGEEAFVIEIDRMDEFRAVVTWEEV